MVIVTKLFVVAYSNVPGKFAEKLVIAYKWDVFSSLIYCRKEYATNRCGTLTLIFKDVDFKIRPFDFKKCQRGDPYVFKNEVLLEVHGRDNSLERGLRIG